MAADQFPLLLATGIVCFYLGFQAGFEAGIEYARDQLNQKIQAALAPARLITDFIAIWFA